MTWAGPQSRLFPLVYKIVLIFKKSISVYYIYGFSYKSTATIFVFKYLQYFIFIIFSETLRKCEKSSGKIKNLIILETLSQLFRYFEYQDLSIILEDRDSGERMQQFWKRRRIKEEYREYYKSFDITILLFALQCH